MLIILLAIVLLAGCPFIQRGDFKASVVIEGQPAPFAGWNVGPDLWIEEGDIIKVSGGHIWVRYFDPNEWSE